MTPAHRLFEPFKMGDMTLANHMVMAPLTRSRADAQGVHGELAATYYGQRASAGLIIAEATAVSKQGWGYVNIPGIWSEAQVKGWQGVTKAVHDKGGKIFLQMFHMGRVGHSSLMDGQPVSSTDIPPEGQAMAADFSMQPYELPRALRTDEIPGIIDQFRTGAENAKKAGFDGVEVHGANGYLIDQFLRDGVNKRSDQYGGSIENRARLLLEIVAAVVDVWGPGRVGVRLSPYNAFNSMTDSDPVALFSYVATQLNAFPLAYLHMMEPIGEHPFGADKSLPRVTDIVRDLYKGNLMANGGITRDIGEAMLTEKKADLICFGVPFIANPDLVERFRHNLPLTQPDKDGFYTGGAKGYIDYPFATQKAA